MIEQSKLEKFHTYVGEVIMCCQTIESDIKMIYAGMRRGDFDENLYMLKKDTLGVVVNNLDRLDHTDKKPHFTDEEYKYMRKITRIRNYWVHDAYLAFIYSDDESYFENVLTRLVEDRQRLSVFRTKVESTRIDVLKAFNRL